MVRMVCTSDGYSPQVSLVRFCKSVSGLAQGLVTSVGIEDTVCCLHIRLQNLY